MALDEGFGHWLAGFIDGEGHFGATGTRGGNGRLALVIRLRDDDASILYEIQARTGMGTVNSRVVSNGRNCAEWNLHRKADVGRMIALLRQYPLRAKKARDFELWAAAHDEWIAATGDDARGRRDVDWTSFWDAVDALRAIRVYTGSALLATQ